LGELGLHRLRLTIGGCVTDCLDNIRWYNAFMFSGIPNPERASIDPRELRDYALNPAHESGRFKAAYFAQMGYFATAWQRLEHDIRTQHLGQPAQPGQPSRFGAKYTITAPLIGPGGEARWVTTVWIVRPGNDWADLVTIEPAPLRKEQLHESHL